MANGTATFGDRGAGLNRELAALNTIAAAVSRSTDLGLILPTALEQTLQVMGAGSGGIYLRDEKTGVLRLADQRGFDLPEGVENDVLPWGEGFSGQAAESGRTLTAVDVHDDASSIRPAGLEARLTALLVVPLFAKNQVVGTLFVGSHARRDFSDQEIELLTSIGHLLGAAVHSARLYTDMEAKLAQLRALQETNRALVSTLELDELLTLIVEQAANLLKADGGIVNMVDWDRNEDEVVAYTGFSADILGLRGALDISLSGWATRHNRPDVSNNLLEDPRTDRYAREYLINFPKNAAVAPLAIKGRVIGTLLITNKSGGADDFERADLDLLVAFANQAAAAIENARLYQQSQELAVMEERSRLARELHDAVTQTLFSASLVAEALPMVWRKDREAGERLLQDLRNMNRGALAEMRSLLLELRPAALTETSLDDLLRQLGEAAAGREGITIQVQIEGQTPLPGSDQLPVDVQIALYRIAQEALNNVVKHARASQVVVRLRTDNSEAGGQNKSSLMLSIRDDGRGFDPGRTAHHGFGLGILEERAQAIGATLVVESRPGEGTQVTVLWEGSEV